MSQLNILDDCYMIMPSIPNLGQTLLLIETNKYFPLNSVVSLDKNIPEKLE